jgi:hypothetical protein
MTSKRHLKCPQCGISNFYVKDNLGNRLLVKVDSDFQIVQVNSNESLDGFNLDELFCLGCSWHGTSKKLKKFFS